MSDPRSESWEAPWELLADEEDSEDPQDVDLFIQLGPAWTGRAKRRLPKEAPIKKSPQRRDKRA
jgi:hypothetical protein